jgi:AraC-like DNA-binding protein
MSIGEAARQILQRRRFPNSLDENQRDHTVALWYRPPSKALSPNDFSWREHRRSKREFRVVPRAPWQIRRARDFVEAYLDGDPSIASLSRECQVSESYFVRAFRITVGMPPAADSLKRQLRCLQEHAGIALPRDTARAQEASVRMLCRT